MDFRTTKVPIFQLALYMLSIRAPDASKSAVDTFIFPLSPQNIRKHFTAMSAVYDTAGDPMVGGVIRQVDSYGISPFSYEIEGTTGWDLHQTDGYSMTGQQAIQRIQQMLLDYAQFNQEQRSNNDPNSYTMEFSDFFNGEFYQVEPIGRLEFRASADRPLLQYYRLRLEGIAPVSAPSFEDASSDPVSQVYDASASSTTRDTVSYTGDVLGSY